MAAIETFDHASEKLAGFDAFAALIGIWHASTRRHRQRQTIVRISRLGPRLIRDIGGDPEVVYGAVAGTWDEMPPRWPDWDPSLR